MKKSLLALAALSAIAGTAQAQSSVTLFGALDAGAYYVNGATTSANGAYGLLSNTIVSSNWGLKGTEDLGGGTKANFYLESGITPTLGTLGQNVGVNAVPTSNGKPYPATVTLFDRGATIGIQGNWGSLDLGNKVNPVFATQGALLPVSGNSVSTNAASGLGFANSTFTHNSLTYTLPTMAGFNAQLQFGTGNQPSTDVATGNNTIGGQIAGSVLAASASYTVGGFTGRIAGQKRWAGGSLISPNSGAGMTSSSSTYAGSGQTTYILGASYNAGAFTLGAGWAANQVTAPLSGSLAATPTLNNNAFQVGVGYQATPAVLLGLSWVGATSGSNLINAQARYAFSKRTQAYAQVGYAANQGGLDGKGLGNFFALSGSSGGSFGGPTAAAATGVVAPTFSQLGLGAGLIHTF